MTHLEIREKFLKFFEKNGHKIVASSSLLPTDQSVLFTTAGMQQFKPYYTGEKDPIKDFGAPNTVSIQKCVRTSDIDQVGDESHLTFFEMLGNFSFGYKPGEPASPKGGYFKEKAIKYGYDFITEEMGLKIDYVSIFGPAENASDSDRGDDLPADTESEKIWKSIAPDVPIKRSGRADNFWGPTGNEGPCGPTTEIYVNGIEIWNIVFNQYYQNPDKKLELLKIPGIDTGMGLERLAMAVQKKKSIFETDLFNKLFEIVNPGMSLEKKRIIVDHVRASCFMINDGIYPSNKGAGYVLRRLMRRVLALDRSLDAGEMIAQICKIYESLDKNLIEPVFAEENNKFKTTLTRGIGELEKIKVIDAKTAFKLYESYGLPYETIKDLAGGKAVNLTREAFDGEFKKHQELSRTASAGMFKGGLADDSAKTTQLHTASHLILEALRQTLGDHVQQKGSNINSERLRFDFSHSEKVTPDQIQQVEKIANEQIQKKLPVHYEEMSTDEAKKIGAVGVFEHKYGEKVKVYFIGKPDNYFSKEICGGPHVKNTSEIGYLKIIKEESVSAGIRRIKAVAG